MISPSEHARLLELAERIVTNLRSRLAGCEDVCSGELEADRAALRERLEKKDKNRMLVDKREQQ